MMMKVEKPNDWPANNREARLENLQDVVEDFIEDPDYKKKEVLVSLTTYNDLNESNIMGVARVSEYEIALINSLYFYAIRFNINSLREYMYIHVYTIILSYRMLPMMGLGVDNNFFDNMDGLISQLSLFYICYFNFRTEKIRKFSDAVLHEMKQGINYCNDNDDIYDSLVHSYIQMMNDLSFISNSSILGIITFTRDELKKLFSLMARLLKKTNTDINTRPLRGTLCITISNWILKSRHNYNENYLYKYMDDNATTSALNNHEIWMQKLEFLNDKREGTMVAEIFKDKNWIKFNWAKKIQVNKKDNVFVTSFSMSKPTAALEKEYGKNYFGYKTDRIGNVLAPIQEKSEVGLILGNVYFYDIIYGKKEAKKELNDLFEIINQFNVSDSKKVDFANQIIPYWIYSFKDKKWMNEKERRYEVSLSKDILTYKNIAIDNRFLKMKSTLFLYPDFISTNNIEKSKLSLFRLDKVSKISTKEVLFCNDCLNDNVIVVGSDKKICNVCGSENCIII
ncbi:hypothetical protein [Breznakia pachnodae]|uniref:Uncharacterized protein n=1 Tax=Breznakia pachnodae TaxID=265178 RepID=A0ABU0E3P1_9FIRM|nr:hypothetical protein [Breznakia pachnodae]MDQ0361517.1 hypothetical protein [Breznakia pachnodae]